MQLKNRTTCIEAERFIRQEIARYQTPGLTVWLKYTRDKSVSQRGYFRPHENRILAAVKADIALPHPLSRPVGTKPRFNGQFDFVQDEEKIESLDELLVWAFFHEFHHFLCMTKQASWNWETRCNACAFEFLRKFKGKLALSSSHAQ